MIKVKSILIIILISTCKQSEKNKEPKSVSSQDRRLVGLETIIGVAAVGLVTLIASFRNQIMTWDNDNEWEDRFYQMEAKSEKHMQVNKILNEGVELDDPLAIR